MNEETLLRAISVEMAENGYIVSPRDTFGTRGKAFVFESLEALTEWLTENFKVQS